MSESEELLFFDTFAHGASEVSRIMKIIIDAILFNWHRHSSLGFIIMLSSRLLITVALGIKFGPGSVSETRVYKSSSGHTTWRQSASRFSWWCATRVFIYMQTLVCSSQVQ